MLKVLFQNAQGSVREGGGELIENWRAAGEGTIWVDITGELGEQEKDLLAGFECHKLAVLDCQRRRHPPKVEEFESNTFVLFRGLSAIDEYLNLEPLQIGLFVGTDYLITVHRQPSISVNHNWQASGRDTLLREPLRLALAILHYTTGLYLEAVLAFEDHLEELEDQLLTDESEAAMRELMGYRSKLRKLRRVFGYHEKLSRSLLEAQQDEDGGETLHAARDLYDRCERLYSLCAMYYEICGDLIDGYLSITSHNLNHTIKILTVITAIFIPLSFVVGLYGMNFEYMPELGFRYAYFVVLAALLLIAVSLFIFFRRKRWI